MSSCRPPKQSEPTPAVDNAATRYADELRTSVDRADEARRKANQAVERRQQELLPNVE